MYNVIIFLQTIIGKTSMETININNIDNKKEIRKHLISFLIYFKPDFFLKRRNALSIDSFSPTLTSAIYVFTTFMVLNLVLLYIL